MKSQLSAQPSSSRNAHQVRLFALTESPAEKTLLCAHPTSVAHQATNSAQTNLVLSREKSVQSSLNVLQKSGTSARTRLANPNQKTVQPESLAQLRNQSSARTNHVPQLNSDAPFQPSAKECTDAQTSPADQARTIAQSQSLVQTIWHCAQMEFAENLAREHPTGVFWLKRSFPPNQIQLQLPQPRELKELPQLLNQIPPPNQLKREKTVATRD